MNTDTEVKKGNVQNCLFFLFEN